MLLGSAFANIGACARVVMFHGVAGAGVGERAELTMVGNIVAGEGDGEGGGEGDGL
jgi:hypothetical protein